jgi:transcriptional regulator with PAS, ATPase and Fis domain
VESELFGYEKGAFTGALKEGKPGKFELADGGTIFLDEIGEMPLEFQPKLLRIVQSRCVQRLGGKFEKKLDIRIIVATNRNLKDEVAARNFREDLYFRFNVLKLTIPPLRDRKKDIAYCAEKFLEHFNLRYPEISKEMDGRFLRALEGHYWPGNVRELQNCIERAFYTGTGNMLTDASSYFDSIDESKTISPRQERPLNGTLDELEGKNVENVLKNCRGDVCLAAEKLGISRASMYRRLKKYGISPKEASGRLS